ncbi:MAG: hypothetical protein GY696_20145, partial [Gammaproteobacteria bacterium]|nr:hypothetical protein [Gammaproteobacteria bacterium]
MYLEMQPSKLNPGWMDGAWTWPWVVFFKQAPDLYRISAYSQATGRTTHTAHVGRLRRSPTGIQEGSAREQKGELPEDPEPEEPLPERLLPEEPLPKRPLPEEPMPEEPLSEEEKTQRTQLQISTSFSPTGL